MHTFANDLERSVGTYLYGRRMYETMVYWETAHTVAGQPPFILDFAWIWQAADKVVYSPDAGDRVQRQDADRARLRPRGDPGAEGDGPTRPHRGRPGARRPGDRAGLVDEFHLFLAPIVVGGGKKALPDGVRLKLELLDERRFGAAWSSSATAPHA